MNIRNKTEEERRNEQKTANTRGSAENEENERESGTDVK